MLAKAIYTHWLQVSIITDNICSFIKRHIISVDEMWGELDLNRKASHAPVYGSFTELKHFFNCSATIVLKSFMVSVFTSRTGLP